MLTARERLLDEVVRKTFKGDSYGLCHLAECHDCLAESAPGIQKLFLEALPPYVVVPTGVTPKAVSPYRGALWMRVISTGERRVYKDLDSLRHGYAEAL